MDKEKTVDELFDAIITPDEELSQEDLGLAQMIERLDQEPRNPMLLNNLVISLSTYKGKRSDFYDRVYYRCLEQDQVYDLVQLYRATGVVPASRIFKILLRRISELYQKELELPLAQRQLKEDVIKAIRQLVAQKEGEVQDVYALALKKGEPDVVTKLYAAFHVAPNRDNFNDLLNQTRRLVERQGKLSSQVREQARIMVRGVMRIAGDMRQYKVLLRIYELSGIEPDSFVIYEAIAYAEREGSLPLRAAIKRNFMI